MTAEHLQMQELEFVKCSNQKLCPKLVDFAKDEKSLKEKMVKPLDKESIENS